MNSRPDRLIAGATAHCLAHCTGCGACVPVCLARALSLTSELAGGRGRKTVSVRTALCTGCGACLPACPREVLALAGSSPKIELCK